MARIKTIRCNKETRREDNFNLRSACSMLLRPLTQPNHTLWCQPEWPWRSYTSEWQANGVRNSFPHRYRNTVRSNREGDACDCLRTWAFQPAHIRSTCIHRRWPQATGNDSTETTRPSTSTPPVSERGKNMHLANMLSTAYLPYKGKEVDDIESVSLVPYLPTSDQRLDKIRAETRRDQSLREL